MNLLYKLTIAVCCSAMIMACSNNADYPLTEEPTQLSEMTQVHFRHDTSLPPTSKTILVPLSLHEEDHDEGEVYIRGSQEHSHKLEVALVQKLEVVFVIDTGANMQRYRNVITDSVRYLKDELEKHQIYPEFCFVTFKDSVEQKCSGFINNNNFTAFQSYVSNLRLTGGGGTNTQNPLAGLDAAADIPRSHNQRIIILITDALPWLEVHNSHRRRVPQYSKVLDKLHSQSETPVFALTRSHDLFFDLTEDTLGQWFDIRKIEKEEISIDYVFNQIGEHLNTLYNGEVIIAD